MSYSAKMRENGPSNNGDAQGPDDPSKPAEVAELLVKVAKLLEEGHAKHALEVISRSKLKGEWITNAIGVCLLRLGEFKKATDLLHRLTAGPGGVTLRDDAPLVFKVNFATSLIATENLPGCLSVLNEIGDEAHPALLQLRDAIERAQKRLPFWKKVLRYLGEPPAYTVEMDFPLGALQ